jgi:hypothetical protein
MSQLVLLALSWRERALSPSKREPLHGEHACFIGSLFLHLIHRFDSVAHFEECSPGVTVVKYANTVFILVGLWGCLLKFGDSKRMLHFPLHKTIFERMFF